MRCAQCHRPIAEGAACPEDGAPAVRAIAEALRDGPLPVSQVVKVVDAAMEVVEGLHAIGRHHGAVGPDAVHFVQVGEDLTVSVWPDAAAPPPPYRPPDGRPGPAADIFGFGVLLHHAVTGRLPAPGGGLPSLADHALQDVPDALDDLIAELVAPDPNRRPDALPGVRARLENLELGSTLSGARLAAVRSAAAGSTSSRQITLSAPDAPMADPTGDTFIRSRADLEAAVGEGSLGASPVQQADGPIPSDPFADTVIGSREEVEARSVDTQDTLLGLTPNPAAEAAMGALDASTELLPESRVEPESRIKWILLGILAGLVVGGFVAGVTMF